MYFRDPQTFHTYFILWVCGKRLEAVPWIGWVMWGLNQCYSAKGFSTTLFSLYCTLYSGAQRPQHVRNTSEAEIIGCTRRVHRVAVAIFSGVHFVMMVKSAPTGEGGGLGARLLPRHSYHGCFWEHCIHIVAFIYDPSNARPDPPPPHCHISYEGSSCLPCYD